MNKIKAFSLLEVVLYIFVFGTLSVALYNFGSVSFQANARSQAMAEVELSGSQLMLKIIGLINQAPEIAGVNYPQPGTSSSSLSVISLITSSNPMIIALENGQVTLKQGASSTVPMTGNRVTASDLRFVNLGATASSSVIKIEFKLTTGASSDLKDFIYSQSFSSAAQPLRR